MEINRDLKIFPHIRISTFPFFFFQTLFLIFISSFFYFKLLNHIIVVAGPSKTVPRGALEFSPLSCN